MRHAARIHGRFFVSFTLVCVAAAWWGCATPSGDTTTGTSSASTSSSSGSSGSGGDVGFDGGGGGEEAGTCTSTSAEAHRVPLDLVFLVDQSSSMSGEKWEGTTKALTAFFNDPASAGIGAGLVFVPTATGCECDFTSYMVLDAPIDSLPGNAFALTNAMPDDATGACTPTFGGLQGALMAATAHQDAHPTHRVNLVFATDGEPWTPWGCDPVTIADIAGLAKGALDYNGVHTYVIGVDGSINENLDTIAAEGGTKAAYNVTLDISQFAATIAAIRNQALGCDFELPPPPPGQDLDPDKVNFTYTPMGVGTPKLLPRADDLEDCKDQPGWYFDSNAGPTKIVLCPTSCATVQVDSSAKVDVLFGCKSVIN
jgi:hypothetical protein